MVVGAPGLPLLNSAPEVSLLIFASDVRKMWLVVGMLDVHGGQLPTSVAVQRIISHMVLPDADMMAIFK